MYDQCDRISASQPRRDADEFAAKKVPDACIGFVHAPHSGRNARHGPRSSEMTDITTPADTLRQAEGPLDRLYVSSLWYRIPIRWQILLAVFVTFLIIGITAVFIGVLDARTRTKVETEAYVGLWQQYVNTQFAKLQGEQDLDQIAVKLRRELAGARHVSARLVPKNGPAISLTPGDQDTASGREDNEAAAPQWFISLVQPAIEVLNVDVVHAGQTIATVYLTAKPDDEVSESWILLSKLAVWWLAGLVLTMFGLYVIVGYILNPLLSFAHGIRELEDGHYDVRLPSLAIRELSPIAENFNTLASALQKARADNSQLYRQLISVQEKERREIAANLHDEVGPCLFGLIANTCSIKHQAQTVPEPQASAILAAAREIATISETLKTMNRSILSRLRPYALGRVSLEELVADLITSFARANPDVCFDRRLVGLPRSFGELVDLTLYRCIQEGLTNALRHGKATLVVISLDGTDGHALRLRISDNGSGYVPDTPLGFGLSMMRERVRSLAGSLTVASGEDGGTVLTISIPNRQEV